MLNIRFVILAIVLSSIINCAKAQIAVGLEGGAGVNYLQTNISNLSYTNLETLGGFDINGIVRYNLNKTFFVSSGISYLQKNYALVRTENYQGIFQQTINTYIQIPEMISIQKGNKRMSYFISAGLYQAYWIEGKLKGSIPNIYSVSDVNVNNQTSESFDLTGYDEKYVFNSQKDKRFEFGVAFNAGTNYFLSKSNFLSVEINLYNSLTDQQKNYMINQRPRLNRTVTFSVGCFHEFN